MSVKTRDAATSLGTGILSEQTIHQNDVPRFFRELTGKRVSLQAIYRWQQTGVRGVKLEYAQLPSGRVTSQEAVHRFINALTPQRAVAHPSHLAATRPTTQTRDHQRAKAAIQRELGL